MKELLIYLIISVIAFPVNAKLSQDQQSALKQTQDLLRNPADRMSVVKESPSAQAAHQKAVDFLGSQQNVNKAYDMAALMLKSVAEEANGDPAKMQQILNRAKSNPAVLADRMPAEFKTMLKQIAGDIEKRSSPARK